MAQDWNDPLLTDTYQDFRTMLQGRDVDAATMVAPASNTPTNYKIWDTDHFENYNGAGWDDLVIGLSGGGTGAANAANARTNLGLGTMAVQNAAAVAITGGTALFSAITTVDNTLTIGTNAAQANKAYFKSGLKIPVGANMYLTS
ncbi:MAG: hypothetical protein ACW99U_18140 [Candidatus Thorarchaeota archaeon]|jgi:hypothetical protein